MTTEPVVLINAFEVPAAADEHFLASWESGRDYLRTQPGYLSTRLHRSLSPTADFRFVNVALWRSVDDFLAATAKPEWRERANPYRFHPALYEVVRDDT